MLLLAMDLLSNESLGGAGVTLGAGALLAFIRVSSKISTIIDRLVTAANRGAAALKAMDDHLGEEKRHHAAMESSQRKLVESMQRMQRMGDRMGVPRPITGDHTPVTDTALLGGT